MADMTYVYDTPINRQAADSWRKPESMRMYDNAQHRYDTDTFDWREGDILLTSFPRSGNHMLWYCCRWLVQGNSEQVNDSWEESMVHFHSFRDNQSHLPRRVFSAHFLPNGIGHANLLSGKLKTIFIYRNPKDSCVSNYNFYRDYSKLLYDPGEFADFAMDFCTDFEHLHSGCWVKSMRAWEEFTDRRPDAPVLPVSYEQIVRDVTSQMKRIADFCGIPASEKLLGQIAQMSSIQYTKQRNDVSFYEKYFNERKHTYLRKGKIGDWKNWFTVSLNQRFDAEINKRTSGLKYEIIYE